MGNTPQSGGCEWLSLSGRKCWVNGTGGDDSQRRTGGVCRPKGSRGTHRHRHWWMVWLRYNFIFFIHECKVKVGQVWNTWKLKPSLARAVSNADLAHCSYCSCVLCCSRGYFPPPLWKWHLRWERNSCSLYPGELPDSTSLLPFQGEKLLRSTHRFPSTACCPPGTTRQLLLVLRTPNMVKKRCMLLLQWKQVHQIHARNSIKLHKGANIPPSRVPCSLNEILPTN